VRKKPGAGCGCCGEREYLRRQPKIRKVKGRSKR